MTYEIVFDVRQQGLNWGWLVVSLLMLVLGGLVAAGALPRFRIVRRRLLGLCFLGCGSVGLVLGVLSSILDREAIATDLQPGHFATIEGPVSDLVLTRVRGRVRGGRFSVRGQSFAYTTSAATVGFHDAGRPLRDGLPVRVTYAGNVILKLEVGR